MRVRNVVISVGGREQVFSKFAETYEKISKGEKVTSHFGVSFDNLNALRRTLTEKRLELLRAIKEKSPKSVYELAKLVSRDLKSVNTDLAALKEVGLVSLKKSYDERNRVMPRVQFDKLRVEIVV
ncbi:MAG: ArsR family transcriptional regulator [Candidatus Woesearchaeota archaeon]